MVDVLCFIMGGMDLACGGIILYTFSGVFFMILGISMIIKGGVSFLG